MNRADKIKAITGRTYCRGDNVGRQGREKITAGRAMRVSRTCKSRTYRNNNRQPVSMRSFVCASSEELSLQSCLPSAGFRWSIRNTPFALRLPWCRCVSRNRLFRGESPQAEASSPRFCARARSCSNLNSPPGTTVGHTHMWISSCRSCENIKGPVRIAGPFLSAGFGRGGGGGGREAPNDQRFEAEEEYGRCAMET